MNGFFDRVFVDRAPFDWSGALLHVLVQLVAVLVHPVIGAVVLFGIIIRELLQRKKKGQPQSDMFRRRVVLAEWGLPVLVFVVVTARISWGM